MLSQDETNSCVHNSTYLRHKRRVFMRVEGRGIIAASARTHSARVAMAVKGPCRRRKVLATEAESVLDDVTGDVRSTAFWRFAVPQTDVSRRDRDVRKRKAYRCEGDPSLIVSDYGGAGRISIMFASFSSGA